MRELPKEGEAMTVRTLTEIHDVDDDTITNIIVGPSHKYCAEIAVDQWSAGEREPGTERRVHLERDDAIALRDALTAIIDASEQEPTP